MIQRVDTEVELPEENLLAFLQREGPLSLNGCCFKSFEE